MTKCLVCGVEFTPTRHSSGKYCSQKCYRSVPKKQSDWRDRFWRYVSKSDGCWLWTGALKGSGRNRYGILKLATGSKDVQRVIGAHRLSWEIHFGPVPDGLLVCHHCDNPQCVRPDHLFLGTNQENMSDCASKGRNHVPDNRGSRHGCSKLTEEQVLEIRRSYIPWQRGCAAALAKKFGIAKESIYGIAARINWRHL